MSLQQLLLLMTMITLCVRLYFAIFLCHYETPLELKPQVIKAGLSHIQTHKCTHTHTYANAYICISTYAHTHMRARAHTHVHTHTLTWSLLINYVFFLSLGMCCCFYIFEKKTTDYEMAVTAHASTAHNGLL